MPSCLCEYKALVNAYKCEITEKSHFLIVNGYEKGKRSQAPHLRINSLAYIGQLLYVKLFMRI